MRVVILGSGVVGVTSAWYLAQAGHEVTVLDRQPAAGLETSFANAGQVSPRLLRPLGRAGHSGQGDEVAADAPPARWWSGRMLDRRLYALGGARCWRIAPSAAYALNKARMVRLAEYSRDCAARAARRHRHHL